MFANMTNSTTHAPLNGMSSIDAAIILTIPAFFIILALAIAAVCTRRNERQFHAELSRPIHNNDTDESQHRFSCC